MELPFYKEKVAAPVLGNLVPRLHIIDPIQKKNPQVIWINGPGGSGKTALMVQLAQSRPFPMLWYNVDTVDQDPAVFFNNLKQAVIISGYDAAGIPDIIADDLQHLRSFSDYFFSCLNQTMGCDFFLILDDYQHLQEDDLLHHLLVHSIQAVQSHIRVIVASRAEMPQPWLRIESDMNLIRIDWQQLRINESEINAFLANDPELSHHCGNQQLSQSLLMRSDGWVAGLKLLLATLHKSNSSLNADFELGGRQSVFRHFSSLVISDMDVQTQLILLKVSILPFIPLNLVNALCDDDSASQIIRSLFHRSFFISLRSSEKDQHGETYVLHDLLREFLNEAFQNQFDTHQQTELIFHAGKLFHQAGWSEEALDFLLKAEYWQDSLDLIEQLAAGLISSGRNASLLKLIEKLPEIYRSQRPRIQYWYGLCLMPMRLQEAYLVFTSAYKKFRAEYNTLDSIRTWSSIVDTIWLEWGDCSRLDESINELKKLEREPFNDSHVRQLMAKGAFTAMSLRRMDHPDMPRWEEENLRMLDSGGLPLSEKILRGLQLMIHYTWGTGNRAKSKLVLDHLHYAMNDERCTETGQCMFRIMTSAHDYWFSKSPESCLNHVETGLSKAAEFCMPFWDVIMINVALFKLCSIENLEGARGYLEKLSLRLNEYSSANDIAVYYNFQSYIAWLENDHSAALIAAEKAMQLAKSTGFSFSPTYYRLCTARILADTGERARALALVARSRKEAVSFKSFNLIYTSLMVSADILYQSGQIKRAMNYANKAFVIGEAQRYFAEPYVKRSSYRALCELALSTNPNNSYLQQRLSLLDPLSQASCKIYVLGRFTIVKHPPQQSRSRKQAKIPSQLLLKLISIGENNNISSEEMVNIIWPEVDWKKGYARLKTSIKRLRDMLGDHNSVIFHDGRIRLNKEKCWIDAWQFETLEINTAALDDSFTDRLFDLYSGGFCDQLNEDSESLVYKSSLETRFESLVTTITTQYIESQLWSKALAIFQQALKRDIYNQTFYEGVVECLIQLERQQELTDFIEKYRQNDLQL